jgi:hypothetical protein
MTPRTFLHLVVTGAVASVYVPAMRAFVLEGQAWPNGNIIMELQLGAPPAALIDGTTNWDDVAIAAIDAWNPALVRSKFVGNKNSAATKARRNGKNNVFFDSAIYGEAFEDRVLAITASSYRGSNFTESDVVVNSAMHWDSFRGSVRSTSTDLRRVLLHEFGHALGLNHPDLATPKQTVTAVMNSVVSNIDALQADDRDGAGQLYGDVTSVPAAGSLSPQTVSAGSPLTLSYINNSAAVSYAWGFKKPGGEIRTLLNGDGEPWTEKTYHLFSAEADDAGTYYVSATNFSGSSAVSSAQVTVNPVNTSDALLANLSARGRAGSGNETFIVGFVVGGTTRKTVLVRAIGPTLAASGVSAPLADPKLTLIRQGSTSAVAENDNWGSGTGGQVAAVKAAFQRVGAFPLSESSKDSAILVDLDPGVYSATVDAQGGAAGIALVEVYDADVNRSDAIQRRLTNVSTRSYAGTGEQKLVAGFVVSGPAPKQILLRAVGPGLRSYGVTNVNTDPNLVVFQGAVQIADNDDWAFSNQGMDGVLTPIFTKVGAFLLKATDPEYDSALLITLPPGVYSAQVSGRHDEVGVVLLELYEVPE